MYLLFIGKSIAVLIFFLLRKTGIDFASFLNFTLNYQLIIKKYGVHFARHEKIFFTGFSPDRVVR